MKINTYGVVIALMAGLGACGGPAASSNPPPPTAPDAGPSPPQCQSGSNACDTCAADSCCAQLQACENSADCKNAVNCASQCGGQQACLNNCASEYPNGVTLANSLSSCLSADCSQQCAPDVSPVGTWNLLLNFAADACGDPASSTPEVLVIAADGSSYSVSSGDATINSGTISCSTTGCALMMSMTFPYNNIIDTQTLDLTLASDNAITGTGADSYCNQPFTVSGTLN